MDFRGLFWKQVWKITFFGLKSGLREDLKNREAHPHQEFPGVPPLPPRELVLAQFFRLSYSLYFLSRVPPNFRSVVI